MARATWGTSGRWTLPAPETLVLLEGDAVKATEPFKLALVELLARGTYRVVKEEKRGGLFGRRPKTHVVSGPKHSRPSDPSLAIVYDLLEGTPHKAAATGEPGVELTELAKAASRRFGSIGGYTAKAVWPALIGRGLAEERQGRALFVIATKKRVLTAAGESAREQARVLRQTSERDLGRLVDEDPSGALALATSAGAIVLISAALYPSLGRLRDVAGARDEAGEFDAGATLDGASDDGIQPSLGGLDLDALGLDFDALDGLSDFSSDVDAGFDSASADSGGDVGSSGD